MYFEFFIIQGLIYEKKKNSKYFVSWTDLAHSIKKFIFLLENKKIETFFNLMR